MAHYAKVNLKELDDQAERSGLAPNIEFRAAKAPLELENSAVSYQRLAPNFRVPFGHKHEQQEEVYIVVSGSARIKIEDEVLDLKQWDVVRLPPNTMRGTEAGPEGVEIIAIGAPLTSQGDSDLVQGWWGGD